MTRRIPIFATLVVLAAVATMIGLGLWQLQRLKWKEALLDRYHVAETMNADVVLPGSRAAMEAVLYRHTSLTCFNPSLDAPLAGRNAKGSGGWAHAFSCKLEPGKLGEGRKVDVVMGWSTDPAPRIFGGGRLRGTIAPSGRVIVDPDLVLAGLQPNARPDPADIPNNHFSYAIQWFFFAATALVIYALALRKRLAASPPPS